jgi:hypothetical protein
MTIATLVKITPAKKLMMKISDKTYGMMTGRLIAECKKKGFPIDRIASFSLANEDGDESFFVMISLDKYDKQNMRKFEQLLKKDVAIQYRMKPYDFIPDGQDEQRCGINLELVSIRQIKPREVEIIEALDSKKFRSIEKFAGDFLKARENFVSQDELRQVFDEIADKAAARAINPPKELNAEEQAIDEDVEKHMAAVLAQLPPKLERQARRRRTPELTDVEKQVKYLDDLIAANERAIGADE